MGDVRSLVLGLFALVACDAPTGLYVTAHTSGPDTKFDRVEFHFGREVGTAIPTGYPVPQLAPDQQLYAHDAYDDQATADDLTDTLTYFVPSAFSAESSTYLLAVAYQGTMPVALGELFEIAVPADGIYEATLELSPYDKSASAIWGANRRCFAWTHIRGAQLSSVALVPDDDSECISVAGVDCREVLACPPTDPACVDIPCVNNTCTMGHCYLDATGASPKPICKPDTCLAAEFCDAESGNSPDCSMSVPFIAGPKVDSFLACAVNAQKPPHIDFTISHSTASYCAFDMTFPLPAPLQCLNPSIVYPRSTPVQIMPASDPTKCVVVLPSTGLLPAEGENIMFAVDVSGGDRTTFVVGLHQGASSQDCTNSNVDTSSTTLLAPQCP